jgi:hypothetical protein
LLLSLLCCFSPCRKLSNECRWAPTTPFTAALGGFCPSGLLSLRTLKADVIAGGAAFVVLSHYFYMEGSQVWWRLPQLPAQPIHANCSLECCVLRTSSVPSCCRCCCCYAAAAAAAVAAITAGLVSVGLRHWTTACTRSASAEYM